MSLTDQQQDEMNKKFHAVHPDSTFWLRFYEDEVQIDGNLTSAELRTLADILDGKV